MYASLGLESELHSQNFRKCGKIPLSDQEASPDWPKGDPIRLADRRSTAQEGEEKEDTHRGTEQQASSPERSRRHPPCCLRDGITAGALDWFTDQGGASRDLAVRDPTNRPRGVGGLRWRLLYSVLYTVLYNAAMSWGCCLYSTILYTRHSEGQAGARAGEVGLQLGPQTHCFLHIIPAKKLFLCVISRDGCLFVLSEALTTSTLWMKPANCLQASSINTL